MKDKLPEGWGWKTIESVCKQKPQSGGTPLSTKPEYYENGDIPWVITADMTEAGMYISKTKKKITLLGLENSSARIFPKGTILFSMYGSIGKSCITKIKLSTNQAILGLIPDTKIVTPKYLYYCLQNLSKQFLSMGRGGTQDNINAKIVKEYKIPVPSIKIQEQIVAKLDQFFKEYGILKEEKEKAKENYDRILQSAIMKLLFKEAELNKWAIKSLSDVTEIIMGQSPPSSSYNRNKKGLPFFQGKKEFGKQCPSVSQWCSSPSKIAEKDDILLSVRAPVGPVNVATEKCCIGRGLSAIRAKEELDPRYLYYFMKGNELNLSFEGRGSTFDSISRKDIDKIRIPVPPTKDIQRELVKKIKLLSAVEDNILKESLDIEKNINQLTYSVLSKAFNGELIS